MKPGEPDPDNPKPEDGAGPEGKAPDNPWLAPAEESAQRRSARIEDLVRQGRGAGLSGPGGLGARTLMPWLAGLAVLGWLGLTSVHVLTPDERGIVTTLGRYSGTIGEGVHFTLPWPIQQVRERQGAGFTITTLPDKDGEALMLTRDGELIDLAFQLRWSLRDARRFENAFADPGVAVGRLATSQMRAAVAETDFDALHQGTRQAEVQHRVAGRLQRALDALGAGVAVEAVEITRAAPPGRLADAFKRVQAARGEVTKERERAEQWAQQTLDNARTEAAAFDRVYAQYKLAPAVIKRRMYYETMERVLSNSDRVVIGAASASLPAPDKTSSGAKQP